VRCGDVVVATGTPVPQRLAIGDSLAVGYDDLPGMTPAAFEDKHVAVLGNGNAAFETVEWLSNWAMVTLVHRARKLGWNSSKGGGGAASREGGEEEGKEGGSEQGGGGLGPGPSEAQGTRLAMMTHYVGDVRGARLSIFDAYELKMVDRLLRVDPTDDIALFRCDPGGDASKVCLMPIDGAAHGRGGVGGVISFELDASLDDAVLDNAVEAYGEAHPELVEELEEQLTDAGFNSGGDGPLSYQRVSEELRGLPAERAALGIDEGRFGRPSLRLDVSQALLLRDPHLLSFLEGRLGNGATGAHNIEGGDGGAAAPRPFAIVNDNARLKIFDAVIRCFGWRMDGSIFGGGEAAASEGRAGNEEEGEEEAEAEDSSADTMPPAAEQHAAMPTVVGGKYPLLSDVYEESSSGVYFAGSLAHGLDYRRSAGGFIHGFRYSARALFRYLEETRRGVPWPATRFALPPPGSADSGSDGGGSGGAGGVEDLLGALLQRIEHAAGPYQMFGGTLLEGITFQATGGGAGGGSLAATYHEEQPPAYFHEKYADRVRLVWFFEYGELAGGGPEWLYDTNVGGTQPSDAHRSTFLHPRFMLYGAGTAGESGGGGGGRGGKQPAPVSQHFMLEDIAFSFRKPASHVEPLRVFFEDTVLPLARATHGGGTGASDRSEL
jgi:hypothetical protein